MVNNISGSLQEDEIHITSNLMQS